MSIDRHPLFEKAKKVVIDAGFCSITLLQKKLKTGYNSSAILMDQLEATGVIGPFDGSKNREVLLKK